MFCKEICFRFEFKFYYLFDFGKNYDMVNFLINYRLIINFVIEGGYMLLIVVIWM